MELFLTGMIAAFNLVASLVFLRFWRDTHDRLFLLFSLAFLAFGLSRFRAFIPAESSWVVFPHIVRFLAILTILAAVIDKNLQQRKT
jgi:hypothetical protein